MSDNDDFIVWEDLDIHEPPDDYSADMFDDLVPSEKVEPRFRDCYEFFEEFLRNAIERRVNGEGPGRGLRWDPDWRRHPEIVLRMQALWEAWEGARLSEASDAMSNWWVHHLDPHLARMLEGSFGPMSPDFVTGGVLAPLPSIRPEHSASHLPVV